MRPLCNRAVKGRERERKDNQMREKKETYELQRWRRREARFLLARPNQQCILNKRPTELRCRNFVNKHRVSIQIGAKRAKARVCDV